MTADVSLRLSARLLVIHVTASPLLPVVFNKVLTIGNLLPPLLYFLL